MPGNVIFECPQCKYTTGTKQEYREHYKTHVADPSTIDANWKIDKTTANLLFHCYKCNIVVSNRQSHFAGKHQVVKEKTRICDLCGTSIETLSKWIYHKRKHKEAGQTFTCYICNKQFARKAFMRAHIKRHSASRNYSCPECGLDLKSQETLRRHKWTHLKDKPHICQHCGKGFASLYNMKNHVRTHTGEKPFRCDYCNTGYAHKVSLNGHLKNAHGVVAHVTNCVEEYDEHLLRTGSRPPVLPQRPMDIPVPPHHQGHPGYRLEDPNHQPNTLEDLLAAVAQHVEKHAASDNHSQYKSNQQGPEGSVVPGGNTAGIETVRTTNGEPNQLDVVEQVEVMTLPQEQQYKGTPGTYTVPVSLTVPTPTTYVEVEGDPKALSQTSTTYVHISQESSDPGQTEYIEVVDDPQGSLNSGQIVYQTVPGDPKMQESVNSGQIMYQTIEGDPKMQESGNSGQIVYQTIEGDPKMQESGNSGQIVYQTIEGDQKMQESANSGQIVYETVEGDPKADGQVTTGYVEEQTLVVEDPEGALDGTGTVVYQMIEDSSESSSQDGHGQQQVAGEGETSEAMVTGEGETSAAIHTAYVEQQLSGEQGTTEATRPASAEGQGTTEATHPGLVEQQETSEATHTVSVEQQLAAEQGTTEATHTASVEQQVAADHEQGTTEATHTGSVEQQVAADHEQGTIEVTHRAYVEQHASGDQETTEATHEQQQVEVDTSMSVEQQVTGEQETSATTHTAYVEIVEDPNSASSQTHTALVEVVEELNAQVPASTSEEAVENPPVSLADVVSNLPNPPLDQSITYVAMNPNSVDPVVSTEVTKPADNGKTFTPL